MLCHYRPFFITPIILIILIIPITPIIPIIPITPITPGASSKKEGACRWARPL